MHLSTRVPNSTSTDQCYGCSVCVAHAIQRRDLPRLRDLLALPLLYRDTFVLPVPRLLMCDGSGQRRALIPSPQHTDAVNNEEQSADMSIRSCGHELIDPEITNTKFGDVINGSCAYHLVNLIELSIVYTDAIFNPFEVICSSGKFDILEPIIYQHLNAMYWKSSQMPEQSEFEDYPKYDRRKRNRIDALDPIRNSTNEAERRWVPGPLRLVAYIQTITSALALATKYLIEYNNSVPIRTFVRTGGLSINSPLETAYHCHFSLIGLHSMVFVSESSPIARLFYRLWHYTGQRLDTRAHRRVRQHIGVLVALGADPNAPITKRRLECFSDGTSLETTEIHSMYECLSRALWKISTESAGPAVVALYRLLSRFGLCSFAQPKNHLTVKRSLTLENWALEQILNSRKHPEAKELPPAGLKVTKPSQNSIVFSFATDCIPERDRDFAEGVARQLVAIGCPDNRPLGKEQNPLTLLQLSRLKLRKTLFLHEHDRTCILNSVYNLPIPRILINYIIWPEELLIIN